MSGPKKKKSSLRKEIRKIEDDLNIDTDIENAIDSVLSIFDDDDDDDSSGSSLDSDSDDDDDDDDSDSGNFGDGDFGGGGSSSDW